MRIDIESLDILALCIYYTASEEVNKTVKHKYEDYPAEFRQDLLRAIDHNYTRIDERFDEIILTGGKSKYLA